jgi:D-3-phosphoglycerate dehydrogenase
MCNLKVGLVGFGDIGRKIATRLKGFGTTILAYDPYCTKESIEAFGCVPVSLDELLEQADFVSLHVRLSPQTQNMFGAAEFAKMKPTAIFVNAARAGLVDEAAMIDALEQKKIGGAVLDVFREEPLPVDHPLRKLKNVTLSAHLAGTDIGTFSGSIKIVADNLEQYFSGGELKNVVNH